MRGSPELMKLRPLTPCVSATPMYLLYCMLSPMMLDWFTRSDASALNKKVVGTLRQGMQKRGDYRLLIVPDHATPIALGTHKEGPVPFLLYDSAPDPAYPRGSAGYWSTFQTGLLYHRGAAKPSLAAYRIPIFITARETMPRARKKPGRRPLAY